MVVIVTRVLAVLMALALVGGPVYAKGKKGAKPAAAAKKLTEKDLLGKWKQIDGEDNIEFDPEGIFKAENTQLSLTGKYLVREDGDLEVDLGLSKLTKGNIIRTIKLEGDKLTLTDPKTKLAVKYQRAK